MNTSRRDLIKGVASLGSLATSIPILSIANAQTTKPLSVGVVGGGIIGASIAWHLSQAGADVTVFEKNAPALGATQTSFAWINAFYSEDHYRALRMQSIYAYQELDKLLQLNITWGGAIAWRHSVEAKRELDLMMKDALADGYPIRYVDSAALAGLAPNINAGDISVAVYAMLEGHLDPVAVTHKFLEHAGQNGARVIYPCDVQELEITGNQLTGVMTTQGRYEFDHLVIASGVDAPLLAEQAGYQLPMQHSAGIAVHSKPVPIATRAVNEGPGFWFKQFPDGRVIGADAGLPPEDIEAHSEVLTRRMDFPNEEFANAHGHRALGKIGSVLSTDQPLELDKAMVGFRPLPEDGLPVVGQLPGASGVYIAVMHSGVTLAPIIGRYITRELANREAVEMLVPYRPERFLA